MSNSHTPHAFHEFTAAERSVAQFLGEIMNRHDEQVDEDEEMADFDDSDSSFDDFVPANDLPDELLVQIFWFLPLCNLLARLASVSLRFFALILGDRSALLWNTQMFVMPNNDEKFRYYVQQIGAYLRVVEFHANCQVRAATKLSFLQTVGPHLRQFRIHGFCTSQQFMAELFQRCMSLQKLDLEPSFMDGDKRQSMRSYQWQLAQDNDNKSSQLPCFRHFSLHVTRQFSVDFMCDMLDWMVRNANNLNSLALLLPTSEPVESLEYLASNQLNKLFVQFSSNSCVLGSKAQAAILNLVNTGSLRTLALVGAPCVPVVFLVKLLEDARGYLSLRSLKLHLTKSGSRTMGSDEGRQLLARLTSHFWDEITCNLEEFSLEGTIDSHLDHKLLEPLLNSIKRSSRLVSFVVEHEHSALQFDEQTSTL